MSLKSLLVLTAVLLITACGGSQNLEEPPDIRFGEDVCEECSMILNEPRHAASYVLTDGTVRLFDDIGDMLAYDSKHHEDVHVYWVHDFNSEDWIIASQAHFVLNNEAQTPMGWGLLAFADETTAADYMVANGGTDAAWADLQTAVTAGELDPGTLSAHFHDHNEMDHGEMEHMDDGHSNHEEMDHPDHHESDG